MDAAKDRIEKMRAELREMETAQIVAEAPQGWDRSPLECEPLKWTRGNVTLTHEGAWRAAARGPAFTISVLGPCATSPAAALNGLAEHLRGALAAVEAVR